MGGRTPDYCLVYGRVARPLKVLEPIVRTSQQRTPGALGLPGPGDAGVPLHLLIVGDCGFCVNVMDSRGPSWALGSVAALSVPWAADSIALGPR